MKTKVYDKAIKKLKIEKKIYKLAEKIYLKLLERDDIIIHRDNPNFKDQHFTLSESSLKIATLFYDNVSIDILEKMVSNTE